MILMIKIKQYLNNMYYLIILEHHERVQIDETAPIDFICDDKSVLKDYIKQNFRFFDKKYLNDNVFGISENIPDDYFIEIFSKLNDHNNFEKLILSRFFNPKCQCYAYLMSTDQGNQYKLSEYNKKILRHEK